MSSGVASANISISFGGGDTDCRLARDLILADRRRQNSARFPWPFLRLLVFSPFISLPEDVEILYPLAMSWATPFDIVNPNGNAAIVIVCDHASNAVPPALGDLGVRAEDLQRHIAWDIGAMPIATRLAEIFDAPAVLCGTSRLVID